MNNKRLTEFALIDIIKKRFLEYKKDVYKGIGDDAAIVKTGDKYTLYTCDALVEEVHFLKNKITPYDLGKKAVAVNLSDIAAMGGKPRYCLISLFLQANITEEYIIKFYDGIAHECKLFDVDIIGGNISKSDKLVVDIFMIGESLLKPILRSGAKVGDLVLVTGNLGNPAMVPTPRIKEGQIIAKSGATAMIDISDGLSSDLGHICEESHVGVELFADKLSTSAGVNVALNRGEDYELCFTISPQKTSDLIEKIQKETGTKVTVIGEILAKKDGRWLIEDDEKTPLTPKGWDHFV